LEGGKNQTLPKPGKDPKFTLTSDQPLVNYRENEKLILRTIEKHNEKRNLTMQISTSMYTADGSHYHNLNNNMLMVAVSLDIEKAFDTT
jgi:hypothetical protein